MYSRVFSTTISGLEAVITNVEIDAGAGIPYFDMSGYLAVQVREAKERVRVAIKNSDMELKPQRIVVNISPANVRKSGTGFDLPIALGLLAANDYVDKDRLDNTIVIGELSLDGSVNSVRGILASVIAARENGFKCCIVPLDNLAEGTFVDGIEVYGVKSLKELVDYFSGKAELAGCVHEKQDECVDNNVNKGLDFRDVNGQTAAKRATLIAVAGLHNIMYIGAPGSGKTMLAKRIPTIMPKLTFNEKLNLTRIYSVAGKLDNGTPVLEKRPFRSPHHSITQAALLGGGRVPIPGEITLATSGVLFLDELTEYSTALLEALRQPLEDRVIHIVRASNEYIYPADFMLVSAINPCKCGYYPDRNRCSCSEQEIKRFLGRISQPIWDRFDLNVQVDRVDFSQISGNKQAKNEEFSSENMLEKVNRAREIQQKRFADYDIEFNSQMSVSDVRTFCVLGKRQQELMERAYQRLNMTARGYYKILKTARTIADIEGEEEISVRHLTEAISYRSYANR